MVQFSVTSNRHLSIIFTNFFNSKVVCYRRIRDYMSKSNIFSILLDILAVFLCLESDRKLRDRTVHLLLHLAFTHSICGKNAYKNVTVKIFMQEQ